MNETETKLKLKGLFNQVSAPRLPLLFLFERRIVNIVFASTIESYNWRQRGMVVCSEWENHPR